MAMAGKRGCAIVLVKDTDVHYAADIMQPVTHHHGQVVRTGNFKVDLGLDDDRG